MAYQGSALPRVRYVYLAQDASDVLRMGGVPLNVYSTAQTAYDAANLLQIASGGKVIIRVLNFDGSGASGDITRTDGWNANVILEGINTSVSVLRNITLTGIPFQAIIRASGITFNNIDTTNSTANGGSVNLSSIYDCTLNQILTSSTFANGSAGSVTINGDNTVVNSIIASATSGNGNGGDVTLNSVSGNLRVTSITSNGIGSGYGGAITATGVTTDGAGNYITSGGASGGCGSVSITRSSIGSIIMTKNGADNPSTSALNIQYSRFVTLQQTNNTTTSFPIQTIVNSELTGNITKTATSSGGFGSSNFTNVIGRAANIQYTGSAASTVTNLGLCSLVECSFTRFTLTHSGASGSIGTMSFKNCTFINDMNITQSNAVTSGTVTFEDGFIQNMILSNPSGTTPLTNVIVRNTKANNVQITDNNLGAGNLTSTFFGSYFDSITYSSNNSGTHVSINECTINATLVSTTNNVAGNASDMTINLSNINIIGIRLIAGSSGNFGSLVVKNSSLGIVNSAGFSTTVDNGVTFDFENTVTGTINPPSSVSPAVIFKNCKFDLQYVSSNPLTTPSSVLILNSNDNGLSGNPTVTMDGLLTPTILIENSSFDQVLFPNVSGDINMQISNTTISPLGLSMSADVLNIGNLSFVCRECEIGTLDIGTFASNSVNLSESSIIVMQGGSNTISGNFSNCSFNYIQNIDSVTMSNCSFVKFIEGGRSGPNTTADYSVENIRSSNCEFYNCVFAGLLNTLSAPAPVTIIQRNCVHLFKDINTNVTNYQLPITSVAGVITLTGVDPKYAYIQLQNSDTITDVVDMTDSEDVQFSVVNAQTVTFTGTPIAGIAANKVALESASVTLTGRTAGSDFLVLRRETNANFTREVNQSILV